MDAFSLLAWLCVLTIRIKWIQVADVFQGFLDFWAGAEAGPAVCGVCLGRYHLILSSHMYWVFWHRSGVLDRDG